MSASNKVEAKVIMAKCLNKGKELYGVRIQKTGGDWVRTWAFKVSAASAAYEGYDKENVSGSFNSTPEYPGCPYCGSKGFSKCGTCGHIFCTSGADTQTCPWCETTGTYKVAERFDIQGGGF